MEKTTATSKYPDPETKTQTQTTAATVDPNEPLYNLSFFQPEYAHARKVLVGTLLIPMIYVSILMWACVSLYYGSLFSYNNLSKLTVYAVDLDGGFLGQKVMEGIKGSQAAAASGGGGGLDWRFDGTIDSMERSRGLVLDEGAWAVLEVSPNASSNLDQALASNPASSVPYNPLNSTTLIYASARNQITAQSKVVPGILAIINPLLTEAAIAHTAQFLTSNANNSTALNLATKNCPQCLTSPFALNQEDLLPFGNASPVVTGTTMVGLIFLLTFSFNVFTVLHDSGMTAAGARLRIRDTLILRTVLALMAYFVVSLWFALITLAFGVDMNFGRGGGRGGGFMVFWMLSWCTMAATGLPIESICTLIGLRWAGYFLPFWIIVNVSGCFTSFELMPGFYLFGRGLPFYHSIQGMRTIILGTKSHLGANFGVLIAWMVIGWLGILFFTVGNMRRNAKRNTHVVP